MLDGHTEAVFASLRAQTDLNKVKQVMREFRPFRDRKLHSAPDEWIHVFDDPFRPQPRLDRERGDGMTTSVGRLEEDPVLGGVKYVLVSHNTKNGSRKRRRIARRVRIGKGSVR